MVITPKRPACAPAVPRSSTTRSKVVPVLVGLAAALFLLYAGLAAQGISMWSESLAYSEDEFPRWGNTLDGIGPSSWVSSSSGPWRRSRG